MRNVKFNLVKSDDKLTLELLRRKIFKTIEDKLNLITAVGNEIERLRDKKSKMSEFYYSCDVINEDIHYWLLHKESLTKLQIKSLFNMLYGLARCW